MAIEFGQSINLNRLQALNLVFHSSVDSSPPGTPVEGQPWYVTDLDVLKIYTGSVWNPLVVGPASSTSGNLATWNGTSGGALGTGYPVVTTIGDPGADTNIPTEQAVREAIASALASEVSFKGGYDASTNTPDLEAGTGVKIGDMYYVSVAGTFFSTPLEAGDVVISNQDSPTLEAHWTMIQRNLPSIIPVASGGTGNNTFTAYSLLASGTTATGAFTQIAETTQYKILFSGTVSAYPTWSPYTMPSTVAAYTMFYASSTSAISTISAAGTTGTFLRGTSGAAPAWSTLVLPNTGTQYALLYFGTANNFTSEITPGATSGMFLRNTAAGAPAWSTLVLPNAAATTGTIMRASGTNTISMTTATYPTGATNTGAFMRVSAASTWSESTLILPNAGTVGDLPHVSTSNTVTMLTSVATAGSFLRGGGTSTVPAWSTVKLPDTMSALGIWVANSANTVVNLTVTANQSIRLNAGGTAWEAYSTAGAGTHAILDGSTHTDSVAGTVARGALIVGNSTPKWALLAFQASAASGYVLATDSADTGWKKQRYVEKLSTSATTYTVQHNLGTRRVMVVVQDTTNNQNILVDWNCKSGTENNEIEVKFGTAPTANTRIVTVFGINFGSALDTAN